MRQFIFAHFAHVLCGLIFLSRVGDIGSTYLVTPKMTLEANLIMRKLGWRFALLTLLICLVPYLSAPMAVMILVPSLLVSASNTAKIWVIRSYGELEYRELLYQCARKGKLAHAIVGILASASFIALAGLVLLFFYPDPDNDWGFWVAMGIVVYAVTIALHGSLYMRRLFKAAREDVPTMNAS